MKNNNYQRVVITGMGVIAPNGHGLSDFSHALKNGKSGIRYIPKLEELDFTCRLGGIPAESELIAQKYFEAFDLMAMNESMIYASIAGLDCYKDALLPERNLQSVVDWDTGAIIGTGIGGIDALSTKLIPKVENQKTKRLGSTLVEQIMCSSVSAKLGGLLGLGGQVTTNSSACTTGTEAIINAFLKIRSGSIKRMMAGGAEGSHYLTWAGFDGMKVLNGRDNDRPGAASRPMSQTANGFIPGAGSGVLMLESLESALERKARIYAEVIGGTVNSGGQRNGGSMTAPNPEGVIRCIRETILMAKIGPHEINAINGHLTATMADPMEVQNWREALELKADNFPLIHSTKSMIGHCLGAAGAIESVASILGLYQGYIHGSINCEDIHENLKSIEKSVVRTTQPFLGEIIAKSSFGFGDVNGCLLFKKWKNK